MALPEEFLQNMKTIIPNKEYELFIKSLSEDEQTTSIRINKAKSTIEEITAFVYIMHEDRECGVPSDYYVYRNI